MKGLIVYKAHVCVLIDPLMVVSVDCDYMDVAEDGSVQLYRGNPLDLVGHFPSVEYVHLEGDRSEYVGASADEELDDEDEDDDEEAYDEDEDLLYDPDDLADVSHVTEPGDDTAALNGSSPGAVVGAVDEG